MVRRLFRNVIYAAAALSPLFVQPVTTQGQGFPVRSGVILARIETNKSVYHVGEPIMLRLTLINKSGHEIFFFPSAPYAISNLEVFNARGKAVPSTGAQGEICPAGCGGHPYTIKLDPGKPVIVEYNDRQSHWALREWADIRHWGYDIRQAGNYTLIASPKLTALGVGVAEFTTSSADKSNAVHVMITK